MQFFGTISGSHLSLPWYLLSNLISGQKKQYLRRYPSKCWKIQPKHHTCVIGDIVTSLHQMQINYIFYSMKNMTCIKNSFFDIVKWHLKYNVIFWFSLYIFKCMFSHSNYQRYLLWHITKWLCTTSNMPWNMN